MSAQYIRGAYVPSRRLIGELAPKQSHDARLASAPFAVDADGHRRVEMAITDETSERVDELDAA